MKKSYLGLTIIAIGAVASLLVFFLPKEKKKSAEISEFREAMFYETLENGKVRCNLCPNRCLLAEGQRGLCKVRQNISRKLYSLVYGKPVTTNVDPIEKKPLFHFLPGAKAYSLATTGCNLSCKYCQNWDISQRFPEDVKSTPMTPQEVVDQALQSKAEVIAFTYNEPTVWYEYMLDIAKLAHEKGLKAVMISSGYINKEPLENLLQYLDAVKIDLKAYNEEIYNTLIGGKLEPVLEAIETVHQSGKWLEIVNLVVPGYTDNMDEIKQMCLWLKDNVGSDVPVHFSRFTPRYKLSNLIPTPEETVKNARKVCLEVGMKYVYTGNILDEEGSTTYCPDNGAALIKRRGFLVEENLVGKDGRATNCPTSIPGVWK